MTYRDRVTAAAREALDRVSPEGLASWAAGDPESEAVPHPSLVRHVRDIWSTRTIRVRHRRGPSHREVTQSVIVVPAAILREYAWLVGLPYEQCVRFELDD